MEFILPKHSLKYGGIIKVEMTTDNEISIKRKSGGSLILRYKDLKIDISKITKTIV